MQSKGALLVSDDFSYSDGDLPTQSGGVWSNISGSVGAGDVQVVSGQAEVSGARSGDDQRLLGGGAHSNDVLFAGFDITFTALPSAATTYFANFKNDSTTFFAKVFGTNDGGSVRIAITTQANNPATGAAWASTFALNTTHRIITKLDQSGGWPATATLWLDPVNEFSTSITAADTPFPTNVNMTAFLLRQSTGEGTILIDNLLIGTTFADVIPEPSTILLVGVGLVGLVVLRRRGK